MRPITQFLLLSGPGGGGSIARAIVSELEVEMAEYDVEFQDNSYEVTVAPIPEAEVAEPIDVETD